MHGSNTRRADLIGGPMHGQNSTVSGNDWHLIRQDGRIWFYLWDEIADAYRLDGSISGGNEIQVMFYTLLNSDLPTPERAELSS